jgi:hypothetical protein
VILYIGKWERGALLFGLQETPIQLVVGNMDIVFIKTAKNFHMVENFTGNRKIMALYAHSLIDTPNTINCEGFYFNNDLA